MTTSAKQRQKQIEKRAKKRKSAKQNSSGGGDVRANRPDSYLLLPIHECLVPSTLFESGIGTLLASRKTATGQYAASSFLTDVYCLGVKDAFFTVLDEETYEGKLKHGIVAPYAEGTYTNVHPSCLKKLILGAVRYADELGFPPHKDYKRTVVLLDNIDPTACPERFEYGHGGKPFYIQGPSESSSRAKRIVQQLERRCDPGNFEMIVSTDPFD